MKRAIAVALAFASTVFSQSFVQWETAHVHPLEMTPDGNTLMAVNTPDGVLEIFDLSSGTPVPSGSVHVGVDPVSVRARDNTTAWVMNFISDTVSIVDLSSQSLVATLQVPDEPSDVMFTNTATGSNAWVSCSEANLVAVFDLNNLATPPTLVPLTGEEPRQMDISPDGSTIYVALQMSGNKTTILSGDSGIVANIVSDLGGPYGGQNPPPNAGTGFNPPDANAPLTRPPVSLIVRKNAAGQWMDDNGGDWTSYVSGANAAAFGRIANWDLHDHELAMIDVASQAVTYTEGTMNMVFGMAVRPIAGAVHQVSLVGTDATNEIRYEPNLKGTFVRVIGAIVDPVAASVAGFRDLNAHLGSYTTPSSPQPTRDLSVGDPRAIVWDSTGTFAWIAGMGSNNVIVTDAGGNRLGTIETGAGPTGLVLDEPRLQLYALNKFSSSVSVIDAVNSLAVAEVPFHDATPLPIKKGRKFLYDTHLSSGHGQAACASCHPNGTEDGLAWDLGDPSADMRTVHATNMDYNLNPLNIHWPSFIATPAERFHPMKGPMTTQTLQDIIGKEPFHWRGDRDGIEDFNGAFTGLLGDDDNLTAAQMQEFEALLASIWFPPNPYRTKGNDLSTSVDLSRLNLHFHPIPTPTNPNPPPVPLTTGDALRGLDLFVPQNTPITPGGQLAVTDVLQELGVHCVTCHVNPTGKGSDFLWDQAASIWLPQPVGARGEHHLMPVNGDPNTQRPFQVPQLRNMHKKAGFNLLQTMNTRGFGYLHDGTVDTISRFVSEPVFIHTPGNEMQDAADLAAFMLSYSGTELPLGSGVGNTNFLFPPSSVGQNTHAGMGFQWTVSGPLTQLDLDILNAMFIEEAQSIADLAIIVKQNVATGGQRGFYHLGGFNMQTDQAAVQMSIVTLINSVGPGSEATFTAVPRGSEVRLGVDRDGDGVFDADEVALGTDPANPRSVPPGGAACTATVPTAPTSVTGTPSIHSVTVNWMDTSSNETGFAVERSWSNSPQWELCGTTGANVTSFTDSSASTSTGYVYRVRAFNCAGDSATSASGTVTTLPLTTTVACHVHAIDLQSQLDLTALTVKGYGTVRVVDDQGRNVKGATVNVTWTGSTTIGNLSAVTNDQGQARFDAPAAAGFPMTTYTWSLQIGSIGGTGFSHAAASDFETSKTITFTTP